MRRSILGTKLMALSTRNCRNRTQMQEEPRTPWLLHYRRTCDSSVGAWPGQPRRNRTEAPGRLVGCCIYRWILPRWKREKCRWGMVLVGLVESLGKKGAGDLAFIDVFARQKGFVFFREWKRLDSWNWILFWVATSYFVPIHDFWSS